MKKKLIYFLTVCALIACNNDAKDSGNDESDLQNVAQPAANQPVQLFDVPWAAVLDSSSQKITMTRTAEVAEGDLNLANVTESLNRKYPEILLTDATQKNDTVYVKINDADYLTQGSGTMGAEIYLAETTYSFTQIPGVGYVAFDFKVGDHASPGTFTRANFKFKH